MMRLCHLEDLLIQSAHTSRSSPSSFFKTKPGEYSAHDMFWGIPVPRLRSLSRQFKDLSLEEISTLLYSPINEKRFLALIMLINMYKNNKEPTQREIYTFYLRNINLVNNWNLVDLSAHSILGAEIYNGSTDPDLLYDLAKSPCLWKRRIAIVSTLYCIKQNETALTFTIAEKLLEDREDLMHKATGWLLREAGKKDLEALQKFLKTHYSRLSRTTLRYAIERFPEESRLEYLRAQFTI